MEKKKDHTSIIKEFTQLCEDNLFDVIITYDRRSHQWLMNVSNSIFELSKSRSWTLEGELDKILAEAVLEIKRDLAEEDY